jgi:hypothetical protein
METIQIKSQEIKEILREIEIPSYFFNEEKNVFFKVRGRNVGENDFYNDSYNIVVEKIELRGKYIPEYSTTSINNAINEIPITEKEWAEALLRFKNYINNL